LSLGAFFSWKISPKWCNYFFLRKTALNLPN
jgi:hypothetical protein